MSKVSDADVEAACIRFSAARSIPFEDLSAESMRELRSSMRAALEAASSLNPVEPVAVGWETPAEWALETDVFNAANNRDVPEWARKIIADLWKQYCLAAHPSPTPKGVTVKALSWEKHNRDGTLWTSEVSVTGEYMVKFNGKTWEASVRALMVGREYADSEAAKTACQDHHDARILSCLSHNAGEIEAGGEVERYRAGLEKISAIRDSIIGFQNVGWSEHIYPLVAALHDAGFDGIGYDKARENVSTLLELTKAAEARAEAADKRIAELEAALKFYAEQKNYESHLISEIQIDNWGGRARAALEPRQ